MFNNLFIYFLNQNLRVRQSEIWNFNPYDAKGLISAICNPSQIAKGSRLLILFIFEVVKLSPRHIWKPLQYIAQQGQSLHIWTISLSTTGCYKNKYTIQFFWVACISRFATAILSGETDLIFKLGCDSVIKNVG